MRFNVCAIYKAVFQAYKWDRLKHSAIIYHFDNACDITRYKLPLRLTALASISLDESPCFLGYGSNLQGVKSNVFFTVAWKDEQDRELLISPRRAVMASLHARVLLEWIDSEMLPSEFSFSLFST